MVTRAEKEIPFLKDLKPNFLHTYSLESLNSRLNVSVLQDQAYETVCGFYVESLLRQSA